MGGWKQRLSAHVTPRIAASAALMLAFLALVPMILLATVDILRGALGLAMAALAIGTASHGFVRRGALRVVAFGAGALVATTFVLLLVAAKPGLVIGSTVALSTALAAGAYALRIHVPLRPAPRPAHPVLFFNPRAGDGCVARLHLCDEARARGIEPIELKSGVDLERLVHDALDAGADALAMAGGDGSQATVARIAAERGIPYACVPAGTRNHFALDLGVDRDDVIGALDAFVDGGERVVDVGEVNGHVFVNNVSLGLYGQAVQHRGYRGAKVRTLLETVPDVLGRAGPLDLRWRTSEGDEHEGGAAIVVSNNRYRLGHLIGDGTRPRLDEGVLGITVLDAPSHDASARTWVAPAFEVHARAPVPVGIDGEALLLDPPLRFRIRRAALRCRIARHHPGASPSAFAPEGAWAALCTLAGIAVGRDPRPVPSAHAHT